MIEVSDSAVINKLIEIVKKNGGEVYETDGYINFFGVRNTVYNNKFNDTFYIYWKENGVFKCCKTTGFTTKPGPKHVLNISGKAVKDGTAILHEGWHKDIWHIGIHANKYEALRSGGVGSGKTKPTKFTRDKTQYNTTTDVNKCQLRVHDPVYTDYIGLNLHKPAQNVAVAQFEGGFSMGCQIFQYASEFEDMMTMARAARNKGQNQFGYFLINKKDFEGSGVVDTSSTKFDINNSQFAGSSGSDSSGSTSEGSQYSNNVSGLGSSGTGSEGDGSSENSNGFETYTSFGTDVVFGKVFPNDDNNRYIDMSSEDISIIQYSEPTLKVEELKIPEKSKISMGVEPDKVSYYAPVVFINDYMIPQTYITNFSLDYSSFAPQVMVEFVDMTNEMLSTNVPKPGSYIKVFIGGNGDEKYYKPIRQDFVITNINKTNKTGGEYQNYPNSGNPIKYRLNGILNVPLGFRKMPWSSSKINARQAIFNISNTVGIGFATNFATNSDVDVMRWVNTQNKSYYDFMKEITKHSCYSPYTFFTSFIDQYYVLNYVECRRLLSHAGKKTDLPQMIYNCIMPDPEKEKTNSGKEDLNNSEQKVSYYFLTNSSEFKGWTNYIEEYFEINEGQSILSDGYSKVITYSDKCGFPDLMSKNYQFILMPIDNLKRDDSKNIMSLGEKLTQDTYIPLNLRQTTNSAYNDSQKMYDNPTAAESKVNFGEVDTSNTFPLYFYASAQNDFQMNSLKKCGLSIRLQNYNPSITRYSRIWVDIYDMNKNSLTQIRKKNDVDEMQDSKIKDYYKNKNENIISFKEETEKDTEHQAYNRSLSGWYVVTDMKIIYNSVKDFRGKTYRKLQTQLTLNRIDYKPSFQSEYDMAKKAIEKYKNDNSPANIMSGGDIM